MSFIERLKEKLGENKTSQSDSELYRHSKDESPHPAVEPDIVCFPENTQDVVMIMHIADEFNVSVTAYGIGSGLESQAIPVKKGISINFDRMNRVVDFSPEDLTITVQPGITRLNVNQLINRQGLTFPIDPGADASIGGMVATNASGTTAVQYGSMCDQVLDLEVVLANGQVIRTGSRAKKSSSGLNLNGIFTGSEGTLRIITEVTLKLHGIPSQITAARCTFDTLTNCAEAAKMILLSGISVMRMELVDKQSIAEHNKYDDYKIPEEHSLFFEFAGTVSSVSEEVETAKELMKDLGCNHWIGANTSKERAQLWKARHEISYAFKHENGVAIAGADVCVPISKLPTLIDYARQIMKDAGLTGGIVGHVGDGNFHTLIPFQTSNIEEKKKAEATNKALAVRAIELGETCTGEYGVGLGKRNLQLIEHGNAFEVMKNMKQMLDPKHLLNPEKIFS